MASLMSNFLMECSFEESDISRYSKAMEDEGYDDFNFFLSMDESDVEQILNDCKVEKAGHRRKILKSWRELVSRKSETSSSTTAMMPSEISSLLIPLPVNEKQIFFNEVVNSVWQTRCTDDIFHLRKYAISAREARYRLLEAQKKGTGWEDKFKYSKDERWTAARNFANDAVVTAKNLSQASSTLNMLQTCVDNFAECVEQCNR